MHPTHGASFADDFQAIIGDLAAIKRLRLTFRE
jgi:hypothetical protein